MKCQKFTLAIAILMAPGVTPAAETVNDAQIASIIVMANQVGITAGRLAKSKASAKDVKVFAQQMILDHTAVKNSTADLAKKLQLKPEDSPISTSLKSDGDKNLSRLKALKGAEFDSAYIDGEVVYHQAVLDAIDKTLIPRARNDELKALLMKMQPVWAAHFDHAKQVQSSLAKK